MVDYDSHNWDWCLFISLLSAWDWFVFGPYTSGHRSTWVLESKPLAAFAVLLGFSYEWAFVPTSSKLPLISLVMTGH